VLYLLAAVMAGTAMASFCPLYAMFGLRTCPAQRVEATDPEHVSPR
jgi:hypothetical protein